MAKPLIKTKNPHQVWRVWVCQATVQLRLADIWEDSAEKPADVHDTAGLKRNGQNLMPVERKPESASQQRDGQTRS